MSLCDPGWPGAPHSVDVCEGLEDWGGGLDPSQLSDTEEDDLLQLVRQTYLHIPAHFPHTTYKLEQNLSCMF